MDDSNLIERVRAGDTRAERELYDAHVDRVYRLAFRMVGDDDLAREFTQETFIRAFERLDTFRGDSALSTWLYAIGNSVVLNGLRKVKRFRLRETDLEEAGNVPGHMRASDPDLKYKLERAIDGLPEKYRMVFVMHDVEGYTHEEIASAMGSETGTSKARLFRARAKLREALSEFAGAWEA